VEENTSPERCTEDAGRSVDVPEEDADYELIESVVHKGKMIRRQLSVQSHSKSVADLFSMNSVDDSNMSITGRKVRPFYSQYCHRHFLILSGYISAQNF
jgi:hypothetical protein